VVDIDDDTVQVDVALSGEDRVRFRVPDGDTVDEPLLDGVCDSDGDEDRDSEWVSEPEDVQDRVVDELCDNDEEDVSDFVNDSEAVFDELKVGEYDTEVVAVAEAVSVTEVVPVDVSEEDWVFDVERETEAEALPDADSESLNDELPEIDIDDVPDWVPEGLIVDPGEWVAVLEREVVPVEVPLKVSVLDNDNVSLWLVDTVAVGESDAVFVFPKTTTVNATIVA
jgi:hypothetical protein